MIALMLRLHPIWKEHQANNSSRSWMHASPFFWRISTNETR
jgi:hypothetical protein